jgi:hypothetical protein
MFLFNSMHEVMLTGLLSGLCGFATPIVIFHYKLHK